MTTVHLVYPHGPRIACPDAIGRNLGQRLQQHFQVEYYDWDGSVVIRPKPGDVLLGHPHPFPLTTFRLSLAQPGWRRVLLLLPYNHGDNLQAAFLAPIVPKCDAFLAITGNYWFRRVGQSLYAHWLPRMIHVDLAVDRHDFPPLKPSFNPPGQRRFLYIGHTAWMKNTDYLSALARELPGVHFGWMGSGRRNLPGLTRLGWHDLSTLDAQRLLATYDFLITVGRADSNPATILEAMAWGLIPVCTPQSGYEGYAGIINIPLDDVPAAVQVLRGLQAASEADLRGWQSMNWALLDQHFNWDRFAGQVLGAIAAEGRPALLPVSWPRRLRIYWLAAVSPYAPWRPHNLLRGLRGWLRAFFP